MMGRVAHVTTWPMGRGTHGPLVARTLAWTGAAALVVLASRSLSYALGPHATVVAGRLEEQLGGPRLAVLAATVPAVALGLASLVLWLAAVAVRERRVLDPRPSLGVRPIRPARVALAALALGLATCTAFALLESYIHWRAGLGWHGIHCLVGPEHRDALPFLWSLSLLAAAVLAALEHLVAWMRRTIATILAAVAPARPRPPAARPGATAVALRSMLLPFGASPRGPPAPLPART
jgi:hypothetical protein